MSARDTAGRVLDIAEPYPGTNWHLWFEIAPNAFVLGSSWKEVALYLGYYNHRPVRPVTHTESFILATHLHAVDVSDMYR